MTLPLTSTILRAAYDLLATTPPFSGWNIPDSEDVQFVVTRSNQFSGLHEMKDGTHTIRISSKLVGHMATLLHVMAHEMIHVHQAESGLMAMNPHDASFHKYTKRVCAYHGFDPKGF